MTSCLRGSSHPSRRQFLASVSQASFAAATFTSTAFTTAVASQAVAAGPNTWQFRYMLASSLFGYGDLHPIIHEVQKTGASAIDLWPKVHGSQREQLDEHGEEQVMQWLKQANVTLGCLTQYKLGPFGLAEELNVAQRMGCKVIVTGAVGPKGLQGNELKQAVRIFVEQMKPHLELAEKHDVTIAIENHAMNLIDSADALRWLVDMRPSPQMAVAFAPYHLPQNSEQLAKLVRELSSSIAVFYAWQHAQGSGDLPDDQQRLQLPGRGPLDFEPIVKALVDTDYQGWTEIFMHPYPRGRAMHAEMADITRDLNIAKQYLEQFVPKT